MKRAGNLFRTVKSSFITREYAYTPYSTDIKKKKKTDKLILKYSRTPDFPS